MGEYVKALLDARHINVTSLANAMKIKAGSFHSYYQSAVISDEILIKITNALGWDLYSIVKNEQARRMMGPAIGEKQTTTGKDLPVVASPAVEYKRRPPSAPDTGLVMMLSLDEYPDEVQLQILRFLQQQPKRQRSVATGS